MRRVVGMNGTMRKGSAVFNGPAAFCVFVDDHPSFCNAQEAVIATNFPRRVARRSDVNHHVEGSPLHSPASIDRVTRKIEAQQRLAHVCRGLRSTTPSAGRKTKLASHLG